MELIIKLGLHVTEKRTKTHEYYEVYNKYTYIAYITRRKRNKLVFVGHVLKIQRLESVESEGFETRGADRSTSLSQCGYKLFLCLSVELQESFGKI